MDEPKISLSDVIDVLCDVLIKPDSGRGRALLFQAYHSLSSQLTVVNDILAELPEYKSDKIKPHLGLLLYLGSISEFDTKDGINYVDLCYMYELIAQIIGAQPELEYAALLRMPQWQKKRLRILERDNWTCTDCEATESMLHVHHKKYLNGRRPWEYPNELLITLCDNCHRVIHAEKS